MSPREPGADPAPRPSRERRPIVTGIGRRAVLAGVAVTAGAAVVALPRVPGFARILPDPDPSDAPGRGAGGQASGTIFASFITDVHIDAIPTKQDTHLQLVLTDMAEQGVPLVLHGGDITEFGSALEYDRYLQLVPEGFPAEIQHVAGNHEVRWDASAGTFYRGRLHGDGSRSFEHHGVHVIMLEVAQPLQEEAHVSAAAIEWLNEDLRRAGRIPSIIVMHCPPGANFHYVNGMDDLFDLIAEYPVRAILAGHNHTETVQHVNGTLVFTGRAVKSDPIHYVLKHRPLEDHDQLMISSVTIPEPGDDGERTEREIAMISLSTDPATSSDSFLRRVSSREQDGVLGVWARVGGIWSDPGLESAEVAVWDESAYGTTEAGTWTEAPLEEGSLEAGLPLEASTPEVLPGEHRVRLRGRDAEDGWWETADGFSVPDGSVRSLDTEDIGGRIAGAMVTTPDGSILLATEEGEVQSFVLRGAALSRQWRTEVGPVLRGLALSADGATVYVPTTDDALVALGTRRGEELWRTDLGAPVTSTPVVVDVLGEENILVSAGATLSRLTAEGAVLWTVPIPVQSTGRAAMHGDTVTIGAGDGTARGYALESGAERWTTPLTSRSTPYQRLLYGPWATTVRVIGPDTVLLGTVSSLQSLTVTDGTRRWSADASAMYTAPIVLPDRRILVVQERGQVAVIDPESGETTPFGSPLQVSLDADPVLIPGTSRLWHVSYTGVLSVIDAGARTVTPLHQVTTSRVTSTPVLLPGDAVLVVGDRDGGLHALDVSQV